MENAGVAEAEKGLLGMSQQGHTSLKISSLAS